MAENNGVMSSKSSDISIEEIGPEDETPETEMEKGADEAEVLIMTDSLVADEQTNDGESSAGGDKAADVADETEDEPIAEDSNKKSEKQEEKEPETVACFPVPPPPTADNSSATLATSVKRDSQSDDEDDELFEDETLVERLIGLTEMFPKGFSDGVVNLVKSSLGALKQLYSLSRTITWVAFSSSAILFLPVMIETERMSIEEAQKKQQRQILLGPGSAALSAGQNAPLPSAPV